jgi:hypothetical protein
MSGADLDLASMLDREHVSAFLTKPFTTAALLETLANIQLE